MSCKSLKGILILFKAEQLHAQDTSRFYNPKVQKVFIIVKGKPNQLHAQGMSSFEQYNKICKYFAEGEQRDSNANEVQKHLQLHDLSMGMLLTSIPYGSTSGRSMETSYMEWVG